MKLVKFKDLSSSLAFLLKGKPKAETPLKHYFSDGVCVREMHIPAGSLVIGAAHKTDHITMLLKGILQIRIGEESRLIEAPYTFEALKGSRKIGYAYTDCIVSNIFPTQLKDIKAIEMEFSTLYEDTLKELE